jgi:hypothetical protein
MSGTTQTTQNQQQQSTTNPWGPSAPALKNILKQVGAGNFSPTTGQSGATQGLIDATTGLPNFGQAGAGAVNNLFGSNTNPQQGMLAGAYGQELGALSPMLGADYTNPYTNPALKQAMSTMNSDITNQIEGQAAAAGRPVGTNASMTQALARGLSQGEGGLLANEFNTLTGNQLQAINQLGGAAGSTASGLTAAQEAALQNQIQGIGAAGSIPGLFTQPALGMLSAQNLQAQLPWANLGAAEGLVEPIAKLGGQSTGNMTGTTSQQQPWQNTAIGAGLLGASMFSDANLKEDIQPVGELYDGTNVYSYKYKGDETPRIGLIAQEIERDRPEAVGEIGGYKAVNYDLATRRSRRIGMLADLAA